MTIAIQCYPYTFRAARVITDAESPVIEDGAVTVVGELITAVGVWSEMANLPDLGLVRDLGDVTLIPGLFDCHIHITADPMGKTTSTAALSQTKGQSARLQRNALSLLDAGVTTARDLGSKGMATCEFRDSIARGENIGPRLLCANAPITVRGGHCCSMGGEAETVEEVTAMAQRRVEEGANVLKVMTSGGFMTAGSKPHCATYGLEQLIAIREEAHKAGIPVTTHATAVEAIERAVDAGFDTIEHCSWSIPGGTQFNERIARKMKERGVAVCPTMNSACRHEHYYCPWDTYGAVVNNLTMLRDIGVTVIAGTDNGIGLCRFERYADGLITMQRAGYTPREILKAATEDAAKYCRVSHLTGRLATGLEADLVALDGNPLEDVECYFKPTFVMARGKEHIPSPIEPFGDHEEDIAEMLDILKEGAKK